MDLFSCPESFCLFRCDSRSHRAEIVLETIGMAQDTQRSRRRQPEQSSRTISTMRPSFNVAAWAKRTNFSESNWATFSKKSTNNSLPETQTKTWSYMSTKSVINVDFADVWGEAGRKKFLRTLAWGDDVTVTKQTSTSIEIETVYFNEQPDGSILPVKEIGFIEPGKSSGIKTAGIVRPHNQNDVLKVNCGMFSRATVRSSNHPTAKSFSWMAETTSCSPATSRADFAGRRRRTPRRLIAFS